MKLPEFESNSKKKYLAKILNSGYKNLSNFHQVERKEKIRKGKKQSDRDKVNRSDATSKFLVCCNGFKVDRRQLTETNPGLR